MYNATLQFLDKDEDGNEMLCSVSVSPIFANCAKGIIEDMLAEKEVARRNGILNRKLELDDYEDVTNHQQLLT